MLVHRRLASKFPGRLAAAACLPSSLPGPPRAPGLARPPVASRGILRAGRRPIAASLARLRWAAGLSSAGAPAEGGEWCRVVCPSEETTVRLAAGFAAERRGGDCYCLTGGVGAGKSVFSRGYIRAAHEDDTLPVPSPTYLLQNIYDECHGAPIHHFDLYRLSGGANLGRLSLDTSFKSAVSLIEWPDRLPVDALPEDRMTVEIAMLDLALKQDVMKRMPSGLVDTEMATRLDDGPEVDGSEWEDVAWRMVSFLPHGKRHQQLQDNVLRHLLPVAQLGVFLLAEESRV